QEAIGCGDERRDRALHVGSAAAPDRAVADLAIERFGRPRLGVTHWAHIGMAGEAEIAAASAKSRVEIGDIRRVAVAEVHALAAKAQRLERARQKLQSAAFVGRD